MKAPELIDPRTQIYRGSAPESIKDIYDLAQLGIKKILCLEFFQGGGEAQLWAEHCHIAYDHIKLGAFFPPSQKEMQDCLDVLANANNLPCYVHCKEGKDRTGMIIGAYKHLVLGQSFEVVKKDMLDHGFHVFPYVFWIPRLKSYS